MTIRERTSLVLILGGVLAVIVAAYAYDGWRAAVAVAGVLAIAGGVLLGIDDGAPAAPVELDDDELAS